MDRLPGCYIDSHNGHYAIPMVVQLAEGLGFPVDPLVSWTVGSYDRDNHMDGYPHEALIELSDEAIEWLNQNEGLSGHWWEWNDGDFGLYPVEDDES